MKTVNFLPMFLAVFSVATGTLYPIVSHADENACVAIPTTASRIFSYEMSGYTGDNSSQTIYTKMLWLDSMFDTVRREQRWSENWMEINCSEVLQIHRYREGSYGLFSFTSDSKTSLEVWCVSRPLQEKFLASTAQKCLSSPTSECFQPDVMAAISNLQSTSFVRELRIYDSDGDFDSCGPLTQR